MGVICVDERVWKTLVEKVKSLTAQADVVRRLFDPQMADGWIDSQDVCRALGVTKRTLQAYRDKRVLPYSTVGGKFFYREKDVADFVNHRMKRKGE